MARIRTIKPDFFRHGGLFDAEQETGLPLRLAFTGLWTACDREGRFAWKPRELKLDALPFDEVDFSRVLDALWTRGHIIKYAVNGVIYGCIPSWHDHQVVNNREAASVLPEPDESSMLTPPCTRAPRPLCRIKGKGREGKGKEGKERHRHLALPPRPHRPGSQSRSRRMKPRSSRWPTSWPKACPSNAPGIGSRSVPSTARR